MQSEFTNDVSKLNVSPIFTVPTVSSETSSVNSLRTSFKNPKNQETVFNSRLNLKIKFLKVIDSEDEGERLSETSVNVYQSIKHDTTRYFNTVLTTSFAVCADNSRL